MKNIVHNPMISLDYPDPDVIRVNNVYYMTTTSVHFTPAIPILRSKDLNHWEIVSYVTDIFEDNATHRLEKNKNAYGNGVWATTLRYHKGIFYLLFNCNEEKNTYVYKTNDIEKGPWQKTIIQGMHHDLSLFFDDDNRVYIIYGSGTIYITELNEDVSAVKTDGINQILVNTPTTPGLQCEGSHFYKINGKYYLFLISWPAEGNCRRTEWCYRSNTLLGEYEGKKLVDNTMGYYNNGIAQGGIIDTPKGDWYAILFQDRFAAGRFPVLLPVIWKDGWPNMGKNGNGEVEEFLEVKLPLEMNSPPLYGNDEFNSPKLALFWQWNHNPDNMSWSLIERRGWLRLKNRNPSSNLENARNTLTQRVPFPWCCCETLLDTRHMKPGDMSGIAAFQSQYGYVGVTIEESGKRYISFGIKDRSKKILHSKIELDQELIWLRIIFDFRNGTKRASDLAYLMYSIDGKKWIEWTAVLHMEYTLDHFAGYRIALYSYNPDGSDGFADFNYMRMTTDELLC